MKKLLLVVIGIAVLGGTVLAQQPDPISDARAHATIDAAEYRATGWGAMAFGASVLLSPLFGGGGVIVAANVITPDVALPPSRLADAQRSYESSNDFMLYQAQYRETKAKPIQQARSRRAWLGTGIGFGVNVLLISLLLATY